MKKENDIQRIRYTVSTFDLETMNSHTRYVYQLIPDGTVTFAHYEKGNRKPESKSEKHIATALDYEMLCAKLNACIEAADRNNLYADDTAVEVKLFRLYDRTDTMDRGYGNENTDVGRLIAEYIFDTAGYPGWWE